jgi:lysophospholipase L1-like esterase
MTELRACFLGDSYVLGVGDPEALGWPGRVTAAAQARGHRLTAYNLGIRGQAGFEILARAPTEVGPRLVGGDARAVVIAFGTNDLRLSRPFAESLAALEGLLALARSLHATAFFVSPPLRFGPADRNLASLSTGLAQVAADAGAAWLDVREAAIDWQLWWREAEAGDGAHPGAASYTAYAAAFDAWPDWRAWLQEAKGTATHKPERYP